MDKTLGKKFRDLRRKKCLSERELSKISGISYEYIIQYEKDRKIPTKKSLKKLAKVLEFDVDEFEKSIDRNKPRKKIVRNEFSVLIMGEEVCYLSTALKKIREELDFNQIQFASILGVSSNYLSSLERGEFRSVNIRFLLKLSKVTKKPIEFFLDKAIGGGMGIYSDLFLVIDLLIESDLVDDEGYVISISDQIILLDALRNLLKSRKEELEQNKKTLKQNKKLNKRDNLFK